MIDSYERDTHRLVGRRPERDVLTGLVAAVEAGQGRTLVVRGPAGIGKTALLDFLAERAAGCRVARAAGVAAEADLQYAALHQLLGPYLDRLPDLAVRHREALGTAFRLRPGTTPVPLLVGLAVAKLLKLLAGEQPVLCVVDDAQWLDRSSAQTLDFVARRLAPAPVGMVFAATGAGGSWLGGLPRLLLQGLGSGDAAALLDAVVAGGLDDRVRNRILAESRGSPLALIESPGRLSAAELAFGGVTDAGTTPLVDHLEQGFVRQVAALPRPSWLLLLIAAAEPVGDLDLLWRAATRLGIGAGAGPAAETTGLVTLRHEVRFRHPLVRSAIYRFAGLAERREVHRVLAEATDARLDPDRRAWHLALAAVGPDEAVAAQLERWADRALAHGGIAATAAFLDQAAALSPDPAQRMQRSLDSARAKVHAGGFRDARALLATAEAGPLGAVDRERVILQRAQLSLAENRGEHAVTLLVAVARRLEPLDPVLARDTYLDALSAALFAGRLASGIDAPRIAAAVRAACWPPAVRKTDVLLDGLVTLLTDGYPTAAPILHRAVRAFGSEALTVDEALRSAWLATAAASSLWDDDGWELVTRRFVEVARAAGAIHALPLALNTRAFLHIFTGDLTAAAALAGEAGAVGAATRNRLAAYAQVGVAAVRGDPARAEPLLRDFRADVVARGEGLGVNLALWARAVLGNGLGRYREALLAAQEAAAHPHDLTLPRWALAESVEAGVRSGDTAAAAAALAQLAPMARASGTDWALGIEASRRALLHDGESADALHREAIDRLGRTRVRLELARAQLLYGEWLRRANRRVDARAQLRAAHEAFTGIGAAAFAGRAQRELQATAQTSRRRTVAASTELTAQETHIARLAGEGLTNPEIGAALFISPRTVEWHLRRIFTKLDVSTRRQLRRPGP